MQIHIIDLFLNLLRHGRIIWKNNVYMYQFATSQSSTKPNKRKQPNKNKTLLCCLQKYSSLISRTALYFLSSSLNVPFLSFPSAKSDSCLLKQQSLKPLLRMTFFSSILHVLMVPECRLDILLDPHCHFEIISVLSSLKNPDFLKLKLSSCANLSPSHSRYLLTYCYICHSLSFIYGCRFLTIYLHLYSCLSST